MTLNIRKIRNRTKARKCGTTLAELPVGLWIVFLGFCFPLFVLVSTVIRFALFWEAAREATDAACQAQYYIDPGNSSNGLGSVALATNTANNVAAMFPGLIVTSVNCYIVATSLTYTQAVGQPQGDMTQASVISPANQCLTSPANPSQNIYQIKVVVSGNIQPLFSMPGGLPIPGLNEPYPVTVSQLRMYENTPGLSMYAN